MLVLSRRQGQKIVIGNEIVVEVVAVAHDGVRLGISAPSHTSVHRFEIFVEIEAANKAAAANLDASKQAALGDLAKHIRSTPK